MVESLAFSAMKRDVVRIVREIPAGRVVTSQALGDHLMIPARHVAFLLGQLSETERLRLPWYRVTGVDGKLSSAGLARGQALRLAEDGIAVDRNDQIVGFAERVIVPREFSAVGARTVEYLDELVGVGQGLAGPF